MSLDDLGEPSSQISIKLIGEMAKKGMTAESPVLIRIFKQESELEVWKQDSTGRYALLKVYPMCRWSGKLGPKTKTGDRQAPEGFYHVSKGMLNPKSQFYLSFNLGYPNRLEAALGYSGEALMVHGACSSSGCYAMTDQGVGEIYALVQNALAGGQDRFQVQAFPFRMTLENMAANRRDPSFEFWRNLKEGYDAFEFSKRQPKVDTCGRRYVFNAEFEKDPTNPLTSCPPRKLDGDPALTSKVQQEDQRLMSLLRRDTPAILSAYADGGMHSSFRELLKQNGADKLAQKISTINYPISRPAAALADPFMGEPWKATVERPSAKDATR
jgi:murein L,D-transpeptidase YafK